MSIILLTGATTGVGLALSRKLLAIGCTLILTARELLLSQFAGEGIDETDRVLLRALDVTNEEQR